MPFKFYMFGSARIRIIQKLIYINESILFYPKLKSFYQKTLQTSEPVIIDVGANKGQTIDFFLGVAPAATLYSFEPNPRLFKYLGNKYAGNKKIKLQNLGVSDNAGTLTLQETVLDETSTFEELNYDSQYLKKKSKVLGIKPEAMVTKSHSVPVVKLSDFIKEQQLKHITVLKIDTEGHEYKCLKGLFDSTYTDFKIEYIQLEQHYGDMYAGKATEKDIIALLKDNGYNVYARIKHGFGNFEEVIYHKP